jgi:hypothetical protein
LVFEKNANFFAENWRKSQKIVITTSAPGCIMNSTSTYCLVIQGDPIRLIFAFWVTVFLEIQKYSKLLGNKFTYVCINFDKNGKSLCTCLFFAPP